MARVELPITVLNSTTGLPVVGAAVTPSFRGSGTPAPWWAAETGGSSSTSAIITDAAGRANAWFNRGTYNLAITGTGITPYTEPWDAIPAGDSSFEIAQIADGTIPLSKLVAAVQQSLMPTGSVLPFAGSAAPTGYFLCDGQAINRVTYSALFTAIGTAYGTGDGSTTFNVPNLAGRFPVGRDGTDTAFDVLGEVAGAKVVTLTAAQSGMPAHTHGDTFALNANTIQQTAGWQIPIADRAVQEIGMSTAVSGFIAPYVSSGNWSYTTGSHTHTVTGAVSSATAVAASASHENLPPYQVVNFIIKT